MRLFLTLVLCFTLSGCITIPLDKQAHGWSGSALAGWIMATEDEPLLAIGAGCAAGVAKEAYDEMDYGGFDRVDAQYTCGGAIATTGVIYLYNKLFKKGDM